MPVPPGLSSKDANQVLRAVMDDTENRLRVDAVISPDGHDLEIHHEDDSIAIGTPTELFTATDVGPKVGLDVNIIGGTVTATDSANGPTGAPVPTDATQVGGRDNAGNLIAIEVSATGVVSVDGSSVTQPISAVSLPLPNGASTSANQATEIASLSSIDSKLNTLGQKTMAASVPVVIASDQSPIPVTGTITTSPNVNVHDGTGVSISSTGSSLNVDVTNTVPVSQSGTWNLNNITGTISLPTGAATSANQTTANTSLASIDSKLTSPITVTGPLTDTQLRATPVPVSGTVAVTQSTTPWTDNITQIGGSALSLGQKTSANSIPVVIASDQSPVAVTGTITTSPNVNVHDGSGVSISSTGSSLNVDVTNTVPVTGPLTDTQLRATPVPISGTVTANAGTGNFTVIQPSGANLHVDVDNFPATQPVSGTVAVTQSTTPWIDNITQFGSNPVVTGTGASGVGIPRVTVSNDSNILATQSGTWNINNVTGTVSLPTGASTSANQTTIIANQTNATQKTQIVDGSGTVVGPEQTIAGTNYLPVVLAASATPGTALVARSIQVAGSDGTNAQTLKTDNTGVLQVNVTAFTGVATSANQTNGTQKSQLVDGSGNVDTIKAATVQSTTADTALVTTPRPTVGTITQAAITVGTTAVRATVSGSAPAATRSVLLVGPDSASTAKFYMGTTTVTSSGATRGFQLLGGDQVAFNNDAADYWIISDTAAQVVYILEQA